MDYPDEWEDSLDQHCQKVNLKVSQINQSSKMWQDVATIFNQTMPKNAKITQMKVIQNLELWSSYQQEIKNLTMKRGSTP